MNEQDGRLKELASGVRRKLVASGKSLRWLSRTSGVPLTTLHEWIGKDHCGNPRISHVWAVEAAFGKTR